MADSSPITPFVEEQADEIWQLRGKLAELEDALKRERHRAELSEQQLEHFLLQHQHQQEQLQHQEHHQQHIPHKHHLQHLWQPPVVSAADQQLHTDHHGLAEPAKAGDAWGHHAISAGHPAEAAAKHTYTADGLPLQAGQCQGGAADEEDEMVLISRKEYDLLLLKDQAISVLQEGITIADCSAPDMPLIFANAGFAKITGYSVHNTLGKNCRFLQGEGTDPATLRELRDAINNGRPCVVQLMNYKKNGDPFVNYLSVTPIRNAAGKVTHYVGIQSDITELVNHRKAELAAKHAALQAAAATEAKSEFLARMSHEIRTPLNGMIAVGQLLAETSLSPAQWDLVNTIRCSGETLLVLITDILDFSRIEANKMVLNHSVFKLETVIEAAMEIAGLRAAQKRLQVAYHITDNTPRVLLGDAQRLQQILLNIVNNAVKFTEDGQVLLEVWAGEVEEDPEPEAWRVPLQMPQAQTLTAAGGGTMAGATPRPPAGRMFTLGEGGKSKAGTATDLSGPKVTLHFSVRDTGIGISAPDVGRLFSSFTQVDTSPTRRYGGSGLGLAISKKLCMCMEGDMWVESPGLGCGTTFSWTIKVRAPSAEVVQRRPKLRRRSAHHPSRPPVQAQGSEAQQGHSGVSNDSWTPGLDSFGTWPPSAIGGASELRSALAQQPQRHSPPQQAQQCEQQQQQLQGDAQCLQGLAPGHADLEPLASHASHASHAGHAGPSMSHGVHASHAAGVLSHAHATPAVQGPQVAHGPPAPHGTSVSTCACAAGLCVHQASCATALPSGLQTALVDQHHIHQQQHRHPHYEVGESAAPPSSAHAVPDERRGVVGGGVGSYGASTATHVAPITEDRTASFDASASGHLASALATAAIGQAHNPAPGAVLVAKPVTHRRPPAASRSFNVHGSRSDSGVMVSGAAFLPGLLSGPTMPLLLGNFSDNTNPLLQSKKVLLVEPCNMIRQVLMLALHSWGCSVCAVRTQQEAIQQFVDAGTLSVEAGAELIFSGGSDDTVAATSSATHHQHHSAAEHGAAARARQRQQHQQQHGGLVGSVSASSLSSPAGVGPCEGVSAGAGGTRELSLRCASGIRESRFRCKGPYDIVMMDMTFTRVLRAITECSTAEAQRLVFMGWPGQSELEGTDAEEWRAAQDVSLVDLPDPVKSVTDKPGSRQLGYVIVTRPVKQGRLMLALEEVMAMQLYDDEPISPPLTAAASASASAAHLAQGGPSAALAAPLPCEASASHVGSTGIMVDTGGAGGHGHGSGHADSSRAGSHRRRSGAAVGPIADAADVFGPAVASLPPGPAAGMQAPQLGCAGAGAAGGPAPASALTKSLLGFSALAEAGGSTANANHSNFCGSSSTSSRLLSLGGDECLSNSGGLSASNGQLSLGNSTLRPATLVKKSASNNELADQVASSSGGSLRILLAEDNAINMKVALGILKRIGHTEVVTAENGEEALRAVEAGGGGAAFHLILMDLHMPIMGGMDAVRELKKRYPTKCAKVVAVTADAFEVTRDDCMAAGFDGWLPKPFRVEDMVRIVNETSAAQTEHADAH